MSCPDCFRGGVATAEPTGTVTTIHGLPTYVAQPPDGIAPKGLIVLIPDAFGWDFVNCRVLSDRYAKGGYLVYLPDFMKGRSLNPAVIPLMDHIINPAPTWLSLFAKPISIVRAALIAIPWVLRTNISRTWPGVLSFFQALRRSPAPFDSAGGVLKIGAAGFCWGGKHVLLLSHDDPATRVSAPGQDQDQPQRLIDAAFTAHPSFVKLPQDAEMASVPTSVVVGDSDAVLRTRDALTMKAVLDARGDDHEMRIEPGAKHGFAVRMHPEDKHEVECAERAEQQALSWFNRWLA